MASIPDFTTPVPTQAPYVSAANYFVTINELTAHNTGSIQEKTVQPTRQSPYLHSLEQYLPYTPVVLVAFLFIVAFGIQMINRLRTYKYVLSALVLVLMLASISVVLTYIGQVNQQITNAGPDEIPREVRVQKESLSSVLISWRTDANHIGVVKLGPAPLTEEHAFVYLASNHTEEVQIHEIRVERLKPGTTYEFEILSGKTWYDDGGKFIQFTFSE
jgi:hypothetical protein